MRYTVEDGIVGKNIHCPIRETASISSYHMFRHRNRRINYPRNVHRFRSLSAGTPEAVRQPHKWKIRENALHNLYYGWSCRSRDSRTRNEGHCYSQPLFKLK